MIIFEIVVEFLFGWFFELVGSGDEKKKRRLTKKDIARAERTPWKRR